MHERNSVPGIEHQIRDKALKILGTKKWQNEYLSLCHWVEFMDGADILGLAPPSLEDVALKYPYPGATYLDWERFDYLFAQFRKDEVDQWALRVLERARELFTKHGPMQKEMFG